MEKFEFLEKPFDDVENVEDFQKECNTIAKKLFNNYGIECGGTIFRFAEIEFYYYEEKFAGQNWIGVTYERTANAGDFYYHLSGVDICFDSKLTKLPNGDKEGYGGGILIRSLLKDKKIIAGPLNCVNEMLNSCGKGNTPQLIVDKREDEVIINPTYRFLGEKDFKRVSNHTNKDGDIKLAFYAKIDKELWDDARRSYFTARFKY